MSPVELAKVRKQSDEYLSKGWIGPSTSPYDGCIFFVSKKDGNLIMCIDYWALNQYTRRDNYLLLKVNDFLDRLANTHCFSSIDLINSYY